MKTSTKWIIGITATALLLGGGYYAWKKAKKSKDAKAAGANKPK